MGSKEGAELRNQRRLRGDKQWPRKGRGRGGVRPDAWCEGGGWPGLAAEKSHTSAPRHSAERTRSTLEMRLSLAGRSEAVSASCGRKKRKAIQATPPPRPTRSRSCRCYSVFPRK